MESEIGIWRIEEGKPVRLRRSQVSLEQQLEDWIESQPELIQRGLKIVGRQVHCDGGIIDLLGIDPYSSSWFIIEIKRGDVRRDTIAQALDYASSLAMMSESDLRTTVSNYLQHRDETFDQLLDENVIQEGMFADDRNIQIAVVGTGRDADLSRIVDYLAEQHDMDITVVALDVFEGEDGELSLVRQLTEQDVLPGSDDASQDTDALKRLFMLADKNGIGEAFRAIYETCTQHGLYPRLYKWSIMYTPPQHKGRCLVVAWVKPTYDKLKAYAIPETFAEFFPISEKEAEAILKTDERRLLSGDEVSQFTDKIDTLFEQIRDNQ